MSLAGKKIIMAEHLDWDSPCQVGSHAYADYFLRDGAQVLWFTSAWSLPSLIFSKNSTWVKVERWLANARAEVRPGLYVYSPFTCLPSKNKPLLRSHLAARHGLRYTIPRVTSWLKSRGWGEVDLLWTTNVVHADLLDMVRYKRSAYRIADMTAAYKDVTPAFRKVEDEVIARVDQVFVASRAMQDYVVRLNKNCQYLPNGVYLDRFRNSSYPAEYHDMPSPKAIYVGAIDERLDINLLRVLAEQLPDVSFCLIGPVSVDVSALVRASNVYLLGCREQSQLAGYLEHADVGIIPFVRNDLTQHVSPLKLLQYFASGLPVVSTDLAEIRSLGSPALLACGAKEFADATLEALRGGRNRPEYARHASDNTWESRYKVVRAWFSSCSAELARVT
ncbi:MAG TPA: glycosyltransferase [Armatimonadota bacterium]|nr:glycosyltransferase [Armatimonadota bacterium]